MTAKPTLPASIRKRLAELENGLEYGNEPTVGMLLQAITAVVDEHDNDGASRGCYTCDVPFAMDRTLLAIARELGVETERPLGARQLEESPTETAGCYQHPSGTFIHVAGHLNCPAYLQGAKPNRRRMRP